MYYVIRRLAGYPFRPDVGEVMTLEEYFVYKLKGEEHTYVEINASIANDLNLCEEAYEAYWRPRRQARIREILRKDQ